MYPNKKLELKLTIPSHGIGCKTQPKCGQMGLILMIKLKYNHLKHAFDVE